jgi:hypothetical protein
VSETTPTTILIEVTAEDIADGERECYLCPVALALNRAFGKGCEANVYERDWEMFVEVSGRNMKAPYAVSHFVNNFARSINVEPFTFTLPDLDSEEWRMRCYRCEELFATTQLDDEGVCEKCRKKYQPAKPPKDSPDA